MLANIVITKVVQPTVGAIFLFHCPICRRTEITLNIWGAKPRDGDAWLMCGVCLRFPPHSMMSEGKEPWGVLKGDAHKGIPRPDVSERMKGTKRSEETRKKISEANRRRAKPKINLNLE